MKKFLVVAIILGQPPHVPAIGPDDFCWEGSPCPSFAHFVEAGGPRQVWESFGLLTKICPESGKEEAFLNARYQHMMESWGSNAFVIGDGEENLSWPDRVMGTLLPLVANTSLETFEDVREALIPWVDSPSLVPVVEEILAGAHASECIEARLYHAGVKVYTTLAPSLGLPAVTPGSWDRSVVYSLVQLALPVQWAPIYTAFRGVLCDEEGRLNVEGSDWAIWPWVSHSIPAGYSIEQGLQLLKDVPSVRSALSVYKEQLDILLAFFLKFSWDNPHEVAEYFLAPGVRSLFLSHGAKGYNRPLQTLFRNEPEEVKLFLRTLQSVTWLPTAWQSEAAQAKVRCGVLTQEGGTLPSYLESLRGGRGLVCREKLWAGMASHWDVSEVVALVHLFRSKNLDSFLTEMPYLPDARWSSHAHLESLSKEEVQDLARTFSVAHRRALFPKLWDREACEILPVMSALQTATREAAAVGWSVEELVALTKMPLQTVEGVVFQLMGERPFYQLLKKVGPREGKQLFHSLVAPLVGDARSFL